MIDDLQRGAQRIIGRPDRAVLAVHVAYEASHRHGGIAAVVHQVVPVLVAQLGHVQPERGQQILRMARRQPARGERVAQAHRFAVVVAVAEQIRFQPIELCELVFRLQARMVRNVIGNAHELVEREDDAAMARIDQPRRNRKVLVAVSLA